MSEAELYNVVIMIMSHIRPDGELSAFSHKEVNYIHELLSKIKAEIEDKRISFAEERDEAFIDAVVNDKWDKVRKYSRKYGVPVPKKRNEMKAGVYKAVQYCTKIPDDVKVLAMQKCVKLGFNPFMKPYEPQESEDKE